MTDPPGLPPLVGSAGLVCPIKPNPACLLHPTELVIAAFQRVCSPAVVDVDLRFFIALPCISISRSLAGRKPIVLASGKVINDRLPRIIPYGIVNLFRCCTRRFRCCTRRRLRERRCTRSSALPPPLTLRARSSGPGWPPLAKKAPLWSERCREATRERLRVR